ncbi:hypothetical protein J8A87_21720 [Vibrio parahaemolyticus]|nr:hypothetical protein [Vibrio parahaemolyticus]MCF9167069.1 hypothetical protein [Vibrio parahaemolyticus]
MQCVFKGLMFLNNINLCAEKSAPKGRLDDSFTQTLKEKLSYAINYANENELKIVLFGNVFRKNFEYEALEMFLDLFSECNPIVYQKNGSECNSISMLKKIGLFNIVGSDTVVEDFKVEDEEDIHNLKIYYNDQLPNGFTNIPVDDVFAISGKSVVLSNKYNEIDMELCSADAIVFGTWDSVSSPNERKSVCNSIVRETPKDSDPSFLVWTPDDGLTKIEVPHQEVVFEENFVPVTNIAENKDQFAKNLMIASQTEVAETNLSEVIDSYIASVDISDKSKSIIEQLSLEVA